MPFQKVEFEFPDEQEESLELEIEDSSAIEVPLGKEATSVEAVEEEPDIAEDEEGGIEIEVVDDIPEGDKDKRPAPPPEPVTDRELEGYSKRVKRRLSQFSKSYHDERRAKETALRERQELERFTQQIVDENKELKGTVDKNRAALIEQAKKTAAGEAIIAKRAFKQAYEAGDADKLAEAQDKMTNAKIKADKIANLRVPTLQEEETPVKVESEEQSAPVPVDERANEWAASNTWFGQDDEMTSLAVGVHTRLTKAGVNPQSDDYYEKINSRMRQVFPEQFENIGGESKRRSNVVAPATRSTAPKKIRLTQTQVTLSKRLGITPEQYARQVAIDMRKQ